MSEENSQKKSLFDRFSLKLIGIVFLIVLPIALYQLFISNQTEDRVERDGHYFQAQLIDKKVRGGQYELHAKLEYDGTVIETIIYADKEVFYDYTIGDWMIVKGLEEHWGATLLCDTIPYDACWGVQPKLGWEELPTCN